MGGEAVGGDNNLFIELIEVVEYIKEFFLGFFLIDDELKIINDETVEFLEFTIEFFAFAILDGVYEIGIEVGNRGIENLIVGILLEEFIADGLNEVSLAETRSTIKEERVVAVAGCGDDAFGGRNGEVIIRTDDKIIESVFLVEAVTDGGFGDAVTDGFYAIFDGGI